MYLNNALNIDRGIFDGCNEYEIKELLKRKSLEDWLIDSANMR